ncbi:hypothetical protein NDU88_000342 [Pleurodeles waltl]|uniref:Uncharacterized protein n=1 Tax=Pleurodeles waltl TaxID=8319 RepID=A0AAV7V6N9_PLEWA|nr:hypothetical protein NDU88_000342 [Pleurodeles waltl]
MSAESLYVTSYIRRLWTDFRHVYGVAAKEYPLKRDTTIPGTRREGGKESEKTPEQNGEDTQSQESQRNPVEAHALVILAAIRDTKHTQEAYIALLVNEVGIMSTEHTNQTEKKQETENNIGVICLTVQDLMHRCPQLKKGMTNMADRLENVHLIGLPERAEG